jgi:histone-lysine N-methyltransferase NSD1
MPPSAKAGAKRKAHPAAEAEEAAATAAAAASGSAPAVSAAVAVVAPPAPRLGANGFPLADEAPPAADGSAPPQLPAYVKLRRSEWACRATPRVRSKDESSVCQCKLLRLPPPPPAPPPPAVAAAATASADTSAGAAAAPGAPAAKKPRGVKACLRPRPGCGRECLNRSMSTFCDARTCPSGDACSNRPFQQLPQPRTKPFLTRSGRGWGLKAAEAIPRGTFVVEYVGEIIDDDLCEQRLWADKAAGETNFYMMEVNRNTVIDARHKGNTSRLINSACEPNCETQRWVDGGTGETRVGIFTLRDVGAGEELTYDYCFTHFGGDSATSFRCACGAARCRGTLDANPQRGLNRGRRIEVEWDDGVFYAATVAGYNAGSGKARSRAGRLRLVLCVCSPTHPPSRSLCALLCAQFKLVYDDGDTESVRLEADAAKRAAHDVNFRWLPEQDAPPQPTTETQQTQHGAAPKSGGDASGSGAVPAAAAAMESDAPTARGAAKEAAHTGGAAGGAGPQAVVEGAAAPMLLQDVSNVGAAAALSPVRLASPRRTTPRRTPAAPPTRPLCVSPPRPAAPCAVVE